MEDRGIVGGNGWIRTAHTIERQLKLYAKSEEATERHQILWHAWNQNKRWLSQMLEWTLPSFQTYSYHNATHSDSVLYNIERILGEERIKRLSATDCFMLLHAAYMHDVGMSISSAERQEMVLDDKFIDMIERLGMEGDSDMRKAAQSVLQTNYTSFAETSTRERSPKLKGLLHDKLDCYYGLGQLMAEYQRGMHASKVKDRLQKQTLDPDKLGNSFSVSGIPLRIFLKIADCAAIHATSGIGPVLELPKEDSGYVLDTIHPRFVAVMLQLGDALDMDNDRFNPFCFEFAGGFPQMSKLHFKKHQAIRQLNITPETIQIHADCDSQEVLRLVRMECEGLEEILKNVSYYWAEIAPNEISGCLPTLDQSKILLGGQQVPGELVKAQFNISQVRAFRLLEGGNVYGGNLVFLREIIQNAIDASKMQCWEDYIYRCKLKERKILQDNFETVEYGLNASEKEILSEMDVWDYPIEIYFELGAKIQNEEEKFEFVPIEEIKKMEEIKEKRDIEKEYGIRITIRDHGTGISKDDLIKISNVGSSYEEKKHFIDKMPDWLKPTGQFGIGLQSVFLVTDSVTARTYTRSGEKYEITFNKVSNGSGGYINVKPLAQDEYITFGTTFEIFLNYKYKLPHADFWEAWNTESDDADRFINEYDEMRPIRHSKEMLNQLIMYIDNMLGENLFPVYVKIKGTTFDHKHYEYIAKNVKKIVLETDIVAPKSRAEQEQNVSWLFKAIKPEKYKAQDNDDDLIIVDIKDGIGALDCKQSKLYIWNSELGVFARFGGSRMLSTHSAVSKQGEIEMQDRRKTKIYLKGIFIQNHSMYQDSELLELIDIKGGKIEKAHIAINRNEFKKEGIDYLEQKIYPALIASAKAVLIELNERENHEREKVNPFYERIMNSIKAKTLLCQTAKENVEKLKLDLEETVLSAVGLSYFLRVLGKEKEIFCEKRGKAEECRWDRLLNEIVEFRLESMERDEDRQGKNVLSEAFDKYIDVGMMHKMRVLFYDTVKRTGFEGPEKWMDYASLLLERRKVAIISMRHNEHSKWFQVPMIICEREKEEGSSRNISQEKVQNDSYSIFQKKSVTWQEEMEILTQLERWADGIFTWIRGIEDFETLHEKHGTNSEVQYTLNYMLGNVPTIALYANKSGNVRINVLSAEHRDSVFFNKSMKRIILKKVNDLYTQFQAKRFVTNVWRSYECISLETAPSSVCVANGAFIAKHQNSKMLLPVLGENVQKLLNLQEQDFFKEVKEQKKQCEQLEELCDNLMGFRQRLEGVICKGKKEDVVDKELSTYLEAEKVFEDAGQKDVVHGKNLVRYYWQEMSSFAKDEMTKYQGKSSQEEESKECAFDDLWVKRPQESKAENQIETSKEAFQCEFIRRFFEARGIQIDMQETLANKQRENNWEWFQKAIKFIGEHRNLDLRKQVVSHPQVDEFKKSLWGKPINSDLETVQKNMINYVMKHTAEKLSEKQIRNCYEKLLDDMLESVLEIETEEKRKYHNIDSLF